MLPAAHPHPEIPKVPPPGLYKVFVISDVCNRSLCVIPFDFIKPDNINILH